MREGGGTSRPSESPAGSAISHAAARPTGSARPITIRWMRADVSTDGARTAVPSAAVGLASTDIPTENMGRATKSTSANTLGVGAPSPRIRNRVYPISALLVRKSGKPDLRRGEVKRRKSSIPRQRDVVVDEVIDRLLHVDIRRDHARLLERNPRRQDRVALRRADAAVGELGALLELLVDHRVGQLGDGDERLLHLVVVREREFACLLVDRKHPAH